MASSLETSPNLLVNRAEFGDASGLGNGVVTVPGWTVTGNPTVIQYGTLKNSWPTGLSFQMPNLPAIFGYPGTNQAPPDGGDQFFGGGNVIFVELHPDRGPRAPLARKSTTMRCSSISAATWADTARPVPRDGGSPVPRREQALPRKCRLLTRHQPEPLGTTWIQTARDHGTIPIGTRSAVVTLQMHDLNPVHFGFTARYK